MPIFIYNLPFRISLQSIQKNRNGSVRAYPVYARSAMMSMVADLTALAIPKFSYIHFMRFVFIIWRTPSSIF